MDWTLLGIAPTKDKKEITKAYRQKLRVTNPEDKPEEFKALREAYEEALTLADREEPAPDTSPIGRWMEAVTAVYDRYDRRIDPTQWQELLRQDVCQALDSRQEAEEALLRFLMAHYCLPQAVWRVLDGDFCWEQRREELYETWPREFIDQAVINGLHLEPSLPYDLFRPGICGGDCDAYRLLFYRTNRTPLEELDGVLRQMEALSEQHPYGRAVRCQWQIETGDVQGGREGLRALAAEFPEDARLKLNWAEICLAEADFSQAKAIAQEILAADPDYVAAQFTLARCLAGEGCYKEAKEQLYALMRCGGSDPVLVDKYVQTIRQWNETLIAQLEQRQQECPEDVDNSMELAWCYAQNDREEDAMALAQTVVPSEDKLLQYHNLMGKLHHNRGDFAPAVEHLKIAEQLIRELTEDGSEETEKWKNRLPEMLQMQGHCLMQLEQPELAMEKLEQAVALAPENPEVLTFMGRILHARGMYVQAVEIFERLAQVSREAWFGGMLQALCLYRLRRDREAFDVVNRTLAIQSTDLGLYQLKMQILIRNGVWEEVHDILQYLEENGVGEDLTLDFIRAELQELEAGDTADAFARYQAIARRVEAGEESAFTAELYLRMARLMQRHMDLDLAEDRELLLAQIDKGLAQNAFDTECLAYKAWVIAQGGDLPGAEALYKEILQRNPGDVLALQNLGELYYENIGKYAREALGCFTQLLQLQKTPELCFYAATCLRLLGDREGAREYYQMELDMDPDDMDAYWGMALLSDQAGDYDRSLELLDKALAVMDESGQINGRIADHKTQVLRRMGRYEQALAWVETAMERYGCVDGYSQQVDICCQFGLWEQAAQVLSRWKRSGQDPGGRMEAEGRVHLLRGKIFRAVLAMAPAKHRLPPAQVQNFRLQLADLECNYNRQIVLWSRRVQEDPDDYTILGMAKALWHSGRKDDAVEMAGKALKRLDDILQLHLSEEALYRGRRVIALGLLGREAEAREELAKTRALPLCHHCAYGRCKDADIYEAELEEILGNREKALALYRAGKEAWPDDLDFHAGIARCTGKGK